MVMRALERLVSLMAEPTFDEEIPDRFKCPLSGRLIVIPVEWMAEGIIRPRVTRGTIYDNDGLIQVLYYQNKVMSIRMIQKSAITTRRCVNLASEINAWKAAHEREDPHAKAYAEVRALLNRDLTADERASIDGLIQSTKPLTQGVISKCAFLFAWEYSPYIRFEVYEMLGRFLNPSAQRTPLLTPATKGIINKSMRAQIGRLDEFEFSLAQIVQMAISDAYFTCTNNDLLPKEEDDIRTRWATKTIAQYNRP